MATIRDVARLAGVSAGTVSNVLNRPSYVSASTRARVLQAMGELNFIPREAARQFRYGRGRTFGLALADMGNPFFVDVALGAEIAAHEADVGVVIVNNSEDVSREERNLDLLVQQKVHGVMITPVDERNPRLLALADRGVPIVYVDRISRDSDRCWLATDDHQGGALAARHLAEQGHRRLAFIGNVYATPQVADRLAGMRAGVADYQDATIDVIPCESWRITDGLKAADEIVMRTERERPTAVFCANDLIAIGLMQRLLAAGIDVPGNIAVVGYDDLRWAEASTIPLTSVRQPREQLGRTAVRMLLEEIEQGSAHVHRHELFTPELVVRRSTEIFAERSGCSI